MSLMVARAAGFAAASHAGQVRKYGGVPYIQHPAAVAQLVRETGLDDEVIAAAWLHDVQEDCGVLNAELVEGFGERVARLVDAMTDMPFVEGGPNRVARKARTCQRFLLLQGQDSIDAHTLKACDCLHNAGSIKENDPNFWKVFRREVSALVGVLTLGHPGTKDRLCDVLEIPHMDHSRQKVWVPTDTGLQWVKR